MKKTIGLIFLILLTSVSYGEEKGAAEPYEVKFIIKGGSPLCQFTNNSKKEEILESISGDVTFITKFKTDDVIISEDGPYEGSSISSPHFKILF